LFGADTIGRDVWSRTLFGTRVSLAVALCAMATATLIGTTVGLLSGFFGGWVDVVLMRATEVVMALPTILLAIALASVLPTDPIEFGGQTFDRKLLNLLLAIALVTWTGIARAVRGEVLSLKEQQFVEAARASGASNARILRVHLLPNVLPTVITLATLATAHNILLEAGLSFLNLGVEPATPSWGGMIAEGQPWILSAPWIILVPGVAVVLAVAGFNLLGQAMQETLDAR
jgi:ABC-type dipeptide/oligopeptide/nickel transport system permease subunit